MIGAMALSSKLTRLKDGILLEGAVVGLYNGPFFDGHLSNERVSDLGWSGAVGGEMGVAGGWRRRRRRREEWDGWVEWRGGVDVGRGNGDVYDGGDVTVSGVLEIR